MSKTERDLNTDSDVDAFDELFSDEAYDAAFDDAIENADLELDIADLTALDGNDEDTTLDGNDDDSVEDNVSADLDDSDEGTADGEDVDAAEETIDDLHDAELDGELEDELDDEDSEVLDDSEAVDEDIEVLDDDIDESEDDEYILPEIVAATPDADALTTVGDPDLAPDLDRETDHDDGEPDSDDVSEGILEELRRADIDGPVVPHAPQDDTTAAVRRPRRAVDYDPAPVPIPAKVPRVLGRKPRVRKVTRVVRHVDPWSVFKIAIIAHLVLYVIVLTASVLLWNVANATGTIDNVERFFESFGWNSFEFNGGELYHAGWIAGLFVVIGMTGLAVLAATLFNLITDLVGGVRFTVLEEEVVETRTSPMRRFVVRRPEPEVPALLHDASGPMYREAVVDDTGAHQRPTR